MSYKQNRTDRAKDIITAIKFSSKTQENEKLKEETKIPDRRGPDRVQGPSFERL